MKIEEIKKYIIKNGIIRINCKQPKLHNAIGEIFDVYEDHFMFKAIINPSDYFINKESPLYRTYDIYVNEIKDIEPFNKYSK